ncbi:MAG: hypothetical protein HY699_17480, partial [Deltaproteobacteria bacterium]|nr:hypothetical protein [Deltaproteobacteria bacterium]
MLAGVAIDPRWGSSHGSSDIDHTASLRRGRRRISPERGSPIEALEQLGVRDKFVGNVVPTLILFGVMAVIPAKAGIQFGVWRYGQAVLRLHPGQQ